MSRYRILESVRGHVEDIHSCEDMEIHHPSANARGLRTGRPGDFEAGREHVRVDGEFEEIRRTNDGRTLVKKDFVLSQDSPGSVRVPAPVEGYIHYLQNDLTAAARIYDRPFGEPGAKLLAQALHMDPGSFALREGAHVRYGQPLGTMSDTGTPGSVHAHIELGPGQFRRYIRDINDGTITPDRYPGMDGLDRSGPARVSGTAADGVVKQGERGSEVRELQQQLNKLGYRDADGHTLKADGDFGKHTHEAVEAFQQARGLKVDGIVGAKTLEALHQPEHKPQLTNPTHPDHALYQQALKAVHLAEEGRQIGSGPHSVNLAAALVVEAKREGITQVDRVELNNDGTLARAVQVNPGRDEPPLNKNTDAISTRQAIAQPVRESSEQLEQVNINLQTRQAAERTQTQTPTFAAL